MGQSGRTAVMVVDDDASMRELLVEFLEMHGVEATSAANGRDALVRLRARELRPDAIILDLDMPVMNGWQFRREQLSDPEIAGIPVVIASGSEPGALPGDAHLRKPYAIWELLETLQAVAASRRAA